MPVSNPPIIQYGAIDYVNDVNNWRAEDIKFLADRAVIRYRTLSDASAAHGDVGHLAFISDNGSDNASNDPDTPITVGANPRVVVRTSPTTWSTVVSSENLLIPPATDTGTGVILRHKSSASVGGLAVLSDGNVSVSTTFKVGSSTSISSGIISLTGGGTTATISVSSSQLTSNIGLKVPNLNVTSTSTFNAGISGTTGTFSGALSASGGVTTSNVSTTAITSTTISSQTVSTTGKVNSGVLELNGTSSPPSLSTSAGSAAVQVSPNSLQLYGTGGVTFRTGPTQTPAPIAGVVVNTGPPPPGPPAYPNGTIWFQVG